MKITHHKYAANKDRRLYDDQTSYRQVKKEFEPKGKVFPISAARGAGKELSMLRTTRFNWSEPIVFEQEFILKNILLMKHWRLRNLKTFVWKDLWKNVRL